MKRSFICILLILAMLACSSCALHACKSVCQTCQKCLNADCEENECLEKCEGHREDPYGFRTGDYITDEAISIDTGTAVLDIGAGVYVRSDIAELTRSAIEAIETVTGLDFDGFGYARGVYPDEKIHVKTDKDATYVGDDNYSGSALSEVGAAYATIAEHVYMSPGDLFICGEYTILHELSHVLMYRQQGWDHSQLLSEGFAEYTTYLALSELEKNDATNILNFCVANRCVWNMTIWDIEKMYEHPIEYWFDNTFEYAANKNYTIGFRFMAYLNEVYGDHSQWMLKFNELYPYDETGLSDFSDTDKQIAVLKATYGDDVLDGFYPWLKKNTELFKESIAKDHKDLSSLESMILYPEFNALDSRAVLERFSYNDLYIDLEALRYYISEYKGLDSSSLTLTISTPVAVNLYAADGSYTSILVKEPISLEGISYIKLLGSGEITSLSIGGFAEE